MERYWYAPGPVPVKEYIEIDWSHRSKDFESLYFNCVQKLEVLTKKKVVLIQGSASLAIESVLRALGGTKRVGILVNGSFSRRALALIDNIRPSIRYGLNILSDEEHLLIEIENSRLDLVYVVQFETSQSKLNKLDKITKACVKMGVRLVVDAVSAFPFYSLPSGVDVAIISSSKQLRGLPVLGIVAYKESMEREFRGSGNSYIDLVAYIKMGKSGQTPHTPMVPQILSLERSLSEESWAAGVNAIKFNAEIIKGHKENIIGEAVSPVSTFKANNVVALVSFLSANGLDVYFNKQYMTNTFQVSNFNYEVQEPYEILAERLLEAKKDGLL